MTPIYISNLNMEELRPYTQLSEKMLAHIYEPEPGLFVAESPNVILRALAGGYEPVSFLAEQDTICGETKEILDAWQKIPVYIGDRELLKSMIGYQLTRGLLCLMKRKRIQETSKFYKDKTRIVVLEDVMNPTNVGAIFRSAAALGMEAVLLTKGCCDPLYRRASRVSMGTVFQIPWTWIDDNWQEALKQDGFQTMAMALTDRSCSLDSPELLKAEKIAVIMGTEGEGLKKETIENSDFTVRIPMKHGVDSLNVAAASAVAFWQLGKGRD